MWPNYSPSCRKSVDELLRKGGSLSAYKANKDYGAGPTEGSYAWRLEREIEKRFKVKHAVVVNSGTAALHCALSALDGKGNGGEVITSPYTFSATASSILLAGFIPVFADVDPYTFCISKETVKNVISKRTKAILPVSLFGNMCDVQSLQSFGLPVIEDACQAVGARDRLERYSGTVALAGAYSFNGAKNIPAGECGALVSNSDRVAREARYLSNHGENFGQSSVGYNYRPNELTCCVAYHGLLELEERNQKRRELTAKVRATLFKSMGIGISFPGSSHFTIRTPVLPSRDEDHVYYCFPFTIHGFDRQKFIKRMAKRGVHVGAGYINPTLEKYPAFRKYCKRPLPVVTELSEKTLCLLYDLTPDKPLSYAEHVAECMRKALD